ncbi:hypothetical protein [Thermopirellula anaerolimosa]
MLQAMHPSELVDLAVFVADKGHLVAEDTSFQIPTDAIEGFWSSHKLRTDHWIRVLQTVAEREAPGRYSRQNAALMEEIFTAEILTRVWAAVLHLYDLYRERAEAGPTGQSALLAHLEVRNRALTLLLDGKPFVEGDAVKLQKLQQRNERWTDVLIGRLLEWGDVARFAADPVRARDFSADIHRREELGDEGRQIWRLMTASLTAAYAVPLFRYSPSGSLNERSAASILACFPPELIRGTTYEYFVRQYDLLRRCENLDRALAEALSAE